MTWKPISFEGIASVDSSLYVQLDQFLYEKEGMLGECIVHAIHIMGDTQVSTRLRLRMKLSKAMDKFEKRIQQLSLVQENLPSISDFQKSTSLINNCLWQYVETLESCVIELFQQLDQVGLEKWHKTMGSGVDSIKIMLMQRLEEVSWAIRRMENLLRQYYKICSLKASNWTKFKHYMPWSHFLDSNLQVNLEKSKKYLSFRHKKFTDRMKDYNKFVDKINQDIAQIQNYHVYKSLDSNDQENFKRLYERLKLWELNRLSKSFPSQEMDWAVHQIQSDEKNFQVFNEYYHALKNILFHQARLFKLGPSTMWTDSSAGKSLAIELMKGHRQEIETLNSTVSRYRDFLLYTDSKRSSFRKWMMRSEPKQSQRLLTLSYKIESLDRLFEKLYHSLDEGPSGHENAARLSEVSRHIDSCLHESSHPLASKSLMHNNVSRIMNSLSNLDEIGSFQRSIVDFVGLILSKTLRIDWKYNVAFEIPKFHEVYDIHMGLIGPSEDRQHFNRIKKFNHMIRQIEDWSQNKTMQNHVHEIEHDISDIKGQLQDFLVFIQRTVSILKPDLENMEKFRKETSYQLLEYRYLFGKFLHHLSQTKTYEPFLRKHFLFVYQYFEAIENKLYE